MAYYQIDQTSGEAAALQKFYFNTEGSETISPQVLISQNPQIVMDIPEIEAQSDGKYLVAREFSTSRGSIDILIINANADLVLIETKLLNNPESHRTVVAQAIDYAKAFYELKAMDVIDRFKKNKSVDEATLTNLTKDEVWVASLEKNIVSGNFQVLILGDRIHPNVLGMVASIQSAPHMAFTINLVEIDPFIGENGALFLCPRVVSKTVEVERSVIRIEIDHEKKTHSIESETPEKEGKGSRPILTSQQFLDIVSEPTFIDAIEKFWKEWKEIGGDIRFGVAGFSAGLMIGDKRVAPFFTYYNRIPVLSEKWRSNYNISDDLFIEAQTDIVDK